MNTWLKVKICHFQCPNEFHLSLNCIVCQNFCSLLQILALYFPVFAHLFHQQTQLHSQTIAPPYCMVQAKWNGNASKMGPLAGGLCHLMTSQYVCLRMCKSPNLLKENQFRDVKAQCMMVAMV